MKQVYVPVLAAGLLVGCGHKQEHQVQALKQGNQKVVEMSRGFGESLKAINPAQDQPKISLKQDAPAPRKVDQKIERQTIKITQKISR